MLNSQSVPMSRTAYFVFGPGFTLMGLIFVALGCFFGLHMENFLEHAVSTTGVVIELRAVTDRDNHRTTFAPTFRFSAEDGHIYEIRSTASSNPAEFSVGDVVDVLYLSADPSGAIIDTFLQKWLTRVSFCLWASHFLWWVAWLLWWGATCSGVQALRSQQADPASAFSVRW